MHRTSADRTRLCTGSRRALVQKLLPRRACSATPSWRNRYVVEKIACGAARRRRHVLSEGVSGASGLLQNREHLVDALEVERSTRARRGGPRQRDGLGGHLRG